MLLFNQLNSYYDSYSFYSKVEKKILLLKKIKNIETILILLHESKKISLDTLILKNLTLKYDFKSYRYLYLLSKINISNQNIFCLKKLFKKFIDENLHNDIYLNHLHYTLLNLKNLPLNKITVENYILSLKNKPIFNLYTKDFILLLGYFGSSNSIIFLLELIKFYPIFKEDIFWSIGKIISLNYSIQKNSLKTFINYSIKFLNRKSTILYSDNCFFSLTIIALKYPSIINGNILNNLSNILFIRKEKFLMKKILLKTISNFPLNELEYNIFFQKLNNK